jgi:hypothetical protein
MDILQDDSFQIIFGVGPPASALKFAKAESAGVHEELNNFVRAGGELTDEINEIVARYDGSLAHAENTAPFISSLGIHRMSVCFFKPSGSGGYLTWNDDAPDTDLEAFLEIPVVGKEFWSAPLSDVQLGFDDGDEIFNFSSVDMPYSLDCEQKACSAILDTGSSLIAAPTSVVSAIHAVVDSWVASGENCDDLSKLPDLQFQLGGKTLSLPAESYIGRAFGELPVGAEDFMPNFRRRGFRAVDGTSCEVLVVAMDEVLETGVAWILGMPFFRKYYTAFTYKGSLGHTMSFSVSDSNCNPHSSPAGTDLHMRTRLQPRPATLRVDASKIRLPAVVTRALSPGRARAHAAHLVKERR